MSETYRVLWIDDEFETQDGFIDFADSNDVILEPYTNSEDGINALEKDLYGFDGVILDAKVFKGNKNDEVASLGGLANSVNKLNELRSKRYLPYFVFTGQKGLGGDATFNELFTDVEVFKKGIDNSLLMTRVKDEADKLEETAIRHKYHRVFEVCTEKYIGEKNKGALLNLLLFLQSNEVYDEEKLNSIRKIFEAVLYGCKRKGLIHDKCYNDGKLNITAALKFLTGEKTYVPNYKSCKFILQGPECMSEFISSMASHIREVTNAGSHFEDDIQVDESEKMKSKLKLSMLTQQVNSPYLVKSLIYELCDLLLWFKSYVDENPDFNTSKSRWNDLTQRKLDTPESQLKVDDVCQIEQDKDGNYYCRDCVLAWSYVKDNNRVGDSIKIKEIKLNNLAKTKHKYPYFVTKYSNA